MPPRFVGAGVRLPGADVSTTDTSWGGGTVSSGALREKRGKESFQPRPFFDGDGLPFFGGSEATAAVATSYNDNNGTDTPREPTPREQRKKKEAEKPNAWRKEEKRRQRGRRGTHTLSFDLTLDDDEPSLYLAYSHPYTYTDLQAFLATLAADPARSATYTRRSLCDTVAGNRCDLLTITAPPAAPAPAEAPPPRGPGDDRRRADGDREGESRQRRLVVLSSRVHPGESNASWVMQGILDFLTSDDARAVALRRHFVFKICPMLNPDGVIQGNYRCSNSGMDLNRQWSAPSREAHPPVAALKHLIRAYQTRDAHRVALFCDLHGHSRAKGVFLYGILSDADRYGLRARRSLARDARESASAAREMTEKATKKPFDAAAVAAAKEAVAVAAAAALAAATQTGDPRDGSPRPAAASRGWRRKLRPGDPRAFPLVLAKAAYGMFTKKKTTFRLGRGKAGTARAVVCRELGVRRSYTLEVSFMGGVAGRHRDAQFTTRDLLDLGGQWCAALVDFFGLDDEVAAMAKAARAAAAAAAPAPAPEPTADAPPDVAEAPAPAKRDPAKRPPRPKPAPSANFAPPANASRKPRETAAAPKKDDAAADAARAPAPAPGKPAAARPKLGRRASGADLEPPRKPLALKARLGRAQSTIVKRPNRPAAGGPGLRRSTSTSQRGRKPGAKADETRPPARSSLDDSGASSSEAPAPPTSAPGALGASLVASPGASRRGVVQIGDRPPDRPPDYARHSFPAPTPTPTPISSPLRSSLLRHRPSEAPAARLPVDLDAVSDRVSGELERPDRDGSDDDSSAASRGAGPYLLDVDDRVLAEEIRDQPAPRVSFNMSRPGSRASLNFPVVPAAANAPPAEGAAPALPERRPEPPPDSRPSSNDADHRKHRTLSDEKSAS